MMLTFLGIGGRGIDLRRCDAFGTGDGGFRDAFGSGDGGFSTSSAKSISSSMSLSLSTDSDIGGAVKELRDILKVKEKFVYLNKVIFNLKSLKN